MAEQNPQSQPQPAPEPKPGTNPPSQPPPPQPDPEAVKAAVEAALKAERDSAAKKTREDKEEADRKKAEEDGKWKELLDKERNDRKSEVSTMHRENQLLKVDRQLRDYLADEARREYLGNAPDIMLHVEKRLEPDAKPEAVTKLIAEEVKAFMDRTPRGLRGNGAPPAPRAGKLPAGSALPPRKDGDEEKPRLTHIGRGF